MGTPRASRTSAAPHCDVTARLPCLATLAPAAAATSAAPQEILKVRGPPPPVPTQSTSSALSTSVSGTGMDCSRMTSTKPASSAACSPRVAKTASRAAVSTSGACPLRISRKTSDACSRVSAAPSSASGFKSCFNSPISFLMVTARCGRDGIGPVAPVHCRLFGQQDSISLPLARYRAGPESSGPAPNPPNLERPLRSQPT